MQVLSLETGLGMVLVPVGMVAQVVSQTNRIDSSISKLDFVRGSIGWRDMEVPLVMSSELLGMKKGVDEGFERAVILWPMQGTNNTNLFALTSYQSPQVITLTEENKSVDFTPDVGLCEGGKINYSLGVVELSTGIGIIPDLKGLSKDLFT